MPSRSEALRDIIRDALVQDSLHSETADAAGVLSLIYDHHVRDLSRKLTERAARRARAYRDDASCASGSS